MRIVIIAMLLFVFVHQVSAQEKSVPAKEKFRLFKNKINKLSKPDTVKLAGIPDSLRVTAADTIKKPTLFAGLKQRTDSLKARGFKPDSINAGFQKPDIGLNAPDVNFVPAVSDLPSDSIKRKAAAASDRITTQTTRIQEKLKSKADSIEVPDNLNGLQEKLGNKVNLPQPAINDTSVGNPALPGVNPPTNVAPGLPSDAKVPGYNMSPQIPGLPDVKSPSPDLPGLDVKLPDQKNALPNVDLPNIDVPALDVADQVKDKLPADLPTLDKLTKPDSAQVKELTGKALEDDRLNKYAEPVGEVTDRIDPYKKNLDSLTIKDAAGIAAKEAEAALENTDAMSTLNGYKQPGNTAKNIPDAAMLQRYQDKRILKEEMLRKSKSVMNDKISSLSPQVKDQQQKLGKVKKLNSSVPSVKNMKEKRSEPLKERPLYERIVPGIALQTHKSEVFAIDFAPQVSWRFTTPFSAGAGLFYRVGFDKSYDHFVKGQGVHGFRVFSDYRLVKGLFIHGEYEKTFTTHAFAYADPVSPVAYNSMYVGLGKRYPISRKVYGGLIALYKIEMKDHLAGTSKFNLRVVFEYKTKKVRKPTDL